MSSAQQAEDAPDAAATLPRRLLGRGLGWAAGAGPGGGAVTNRTRTQPSRGVKEILPNYILGIAGPVGYEGGRDRPAEEIEVTAEMVDICVRIIADRFDAPATGDLYLFVREMLVDALSDKPSIANSASYEVPPVLHEGLEFLFHGGHPTSRRM